jgi:hypothetical protein
MDNANSNGDRDMTKTLKPLPTPRTKNPDARDKLIRELLYQVHYAEQELERELERAKRDVERAQDDLKKGLTLNSLGVLQSTGNVDKIVMRRQQAIDALVKAVFHLGYERPETPRWWMAKELR